MSDSDHAALVRRLNLERAQPTEPLSRPDPLPDLRRRLCEAHEALGVALERQEELAEEATYWRQRAIHAEQALAPRDRLRVVASDE